MSLLDVFLQDEANEAEELERVVEGDEFDDRRRSDSDENSEKEDEAEEDKRKVNPSKAKATRIVKNPRFLLNPARLTGPRGIQVIPDHFKDFKFKGKGHEKEDLDVVLKRLEHWAYRLYPKFQFEDCLKKIETLGKKRPVAVHLHKIRSNQLLSEDIVVQKDCSDEETPMPIQEEDEFDKLLQQQIELARSTPAPNSAKKPHFDDSISPKDKRTTAVMMPKATSSPSINDEQRERMLRSRKLAEERRLARLENASNIRHNPVSQSENTELVSNTHNTNMNMEQINEINEVNTDEISMAKKHNRSNVIDSSDEETRVENTVSITVDIHPDIRTNIESDYNKSTDENQMEMTGDDNPHVIQEIDDVENEGRVINNTNSEINDVNKLTITEENNLEDNIQDKCEFNVSTENVTDIMRNTMESSGQDERSNFAEKNDETIKTIESNNVQPPLNISVGKDNSVLSDKAENSTVSVKSTVDKEIACEEALEDVMDLDFSEDF